MERDDDRPVRKPEVPIGDDLALLSVAELEWRIGVLRQEIHAPRIGDRRRSEPAARPPISCSNCDFGQTR